MTLEDVKTWISRIKEVGIVMDDNEVAHEMEDELYKTVLRNIAEGCNNPKELADAALKASELNFIRWYA